MSPTQRSLKLLRDEGFIVAVVEKWNPYARIRQDVFGFGDLLAARAQTLVPVMRGVEVVAVQRYDGIFLIQCTSGTNHAKRVAKVRSIPEAETWRKAGGRIVVLSWSKSAKDKKWHPRWEEIV